MTLNNFKTSGGLFKIGEPRGLLKQAASNIGALYGRKKSGWWDLAWLL
jgi:hypothetical protein